MFLNISVRSLVPLQRARVSTTAMGQGSRHCGKDERSVVKLKMLKVSRCCPWCLISRILVSVPIGGCRQRVLWLDREQEVGAVAGAGLSHLYRRERAPLARVLFLPPHPPTLRSRCRGFRAAAEEEEGLTGSGRDSGAVRGERSGGLSGGGERRTLTRAHTHTSSGCRLVKLVYGENCDSNSSVATQADMEAYLRSVQSRLTVSGVSTGCNEWNRDCYGLLCDRLRSCCWKKKKKPRSTTPLGSPSTCRSTVQPKATRLSQLCVFTKASIWMRSGFVTKRRRGVTSTSLATGCPPLISLDALQILNLHFIHGSHRSPYGNT